MRVSRQQAAENRERILAAASRLFRERGFDGVGVDAVMRAVGLTHGGFYGHFGSKDELIAEAVAHGLDESADKQTSQASMTELANRYLSAEHRSKVGEGCLLAALGADMARQPPRVRRGVTGYLQGQIERIAALVKGQSADEARRQAIVTLSGLVGALVLARAVDDPDLSDDILGATRAAFAAVGDRDH